VNEIPKASTFAASGNPYTIAIASLDVKRTPSVITPVIGLVNCVIEMPAPGGKGGEGAKVEMRLEFGWKDGQWDFERLRNKSGKDITTLPLGKDMLSAGALRDFLSKHGL